jgi:uncharacterized membrane protein YhaH (DUF805 family)
MNIGHLLFSFQGRINRAKYWLAILIYVIVNLVMAALGQVAGDSIAFQLLSLIIGVVIFISGLAVGVKRLHDRDKSGWWLLLFYIVPSVAFAAATGLSFYSIGADSGGATLVAGLLWLVGLAVLIWAVIELGCLRGTPGANLKLPH